MLEFDEVFLCEAKVELDELADEVSGLVCWWRSDEDGWLVAKNLGAIVGEKHLVKNVFLVPPVWTDQFRVCIETEGKNGLNKIGRTKRWL